MAADPQTIKAAATAAVAEVFEDLVPAADPTAAMALIQENQRAVRDDAAIEARASEMLKAPVERMGRGVLRRAPAVNPPTAADFVARLNDADRAALKAALEADAFAGVDPYLTMSDDERAAFDAANDAALDDLEGDEAA